MLTWHTVTVQVPKTADHDDGQPFYPHSLERAVMLAVAEMYVKGIPPRDAEAVLRCRNGNNIT